MAERGKKERKKERKERKKETAKRQREAAREMGVDLIFLTHKHISFLSPLLAVSLPLSCLLSLPPPFLEVGQNGLIPAGSCPTPATPLRMVQPTPPLPPSLSPPSPLISLSLSLATPTHTLCKFSCSERESENTSRRPCLLIHRTEAASLPSSNKVYVCVCVLVCIHTHSAGNIEFLCACVCVYKSGFRCTQEQRDTETKSIFNIYVYASVIKHKSVSECQYMLTGVKVV